MANIIVYVIVLSILVTIAGLWGIRKVVNGIRARRKEREAENEIRTWYNHRHVLPIPEAYYKRLINAHQKAIDINPNNTWAYMHMGFGYSSLGNTQAINCIKKAIEIDPDFVEGYDSLGHIYERMGKKYLSLESHQKAIRVRQEWLKKNGYT